MGHDDEERCKGDYEDCAMEYEEEGDAECDCRGCEVCT